MRRALMMAGLGLWLACTRPAAALPLGAGANDPSIVIGVIATLTGPDALVAQDMVAGFQTALKQLGGRFANQEVRLVVLDDKGHPEQARQLLKRAIERERLDLVVAATNPASLRAILAPAEEAHLFVFTLDHADSGLSGAGCSRWLFSLAPQIDTPHEALGQHFTAERMRKVLVVGRDVPATQDAVTALSRSFAGEIRVMVVGKGPAVFGHELARIAKDKPDAVYTLLTSGRGVSFVRAWAASALKGEIPLYATPSLMERPFLPAMGDLGLDLVGVSSWNPDPEQPQQKRAMADYELDMGRPMTAWAAQGYDLAGLLDSALKVTKGRTHDTEALRGALRKAEIHSLRGSLRFNTNHFPIQTLVLRKVVKDAKGRLTLELRGVAAKDLADRQVAHCPMRWVEDLVPAAGPNPPASGPPAKPQAAKPAATKPPAQGGAPGRH